MNFLAHLFLADASPEARIGSLMPDLVRGKLPADLPAATRAAVEQHRRIDAFTDTHPIVARTKARLAPRHGRYAGIIADVLYDHFLAADWVRFHATPLPEFVAEVHRTFAWHRHLLPEAMRYPVDRMMEQDWLGSYASIGGIELALRRMSSRLSQRLEREVCLETAAEDLVHQREGLAADFNAFFPQLVVYARGPALISAAR